MTRTLALILVLVAAAAPRLRAHEVRPAYLEIRESAPDTYDVLWKVPARGDMRLGVYVAMPEAAERLAEPRALLADDAHVERWTVRCPDGLAGRTIRIDGLAATRIDVLARVEHADGLTQTARLTPANTAFVVEAAPSPWRVARTYTILGVEHILLGIDHLLFVLALLILVKGTRALVETITAFTLAHSVTLGAATLGLVHVPGSPVEAAIALSIVFVAAEIVRARRGVPSLAASRPWLVALAFGLLHGLGFAGALGDIGLPQTQIPLALLLFNVGVELGQLLFIAAVGSLAAIAARLPIRLPDRAGPLPAYAIGAVAMFWVIERVATF